MDRNFVDKRNLGTTDGGRNIDSLVVQVKRLEDRETYVQQYGNNILYIPDGELYLWEQHFVNHSTEHIKKMLKYRARGTSFEKSHDRAMREVGE